MTNGYQIIEIEELDFLESQRDSSMRIAILLWIIKTININLEYVRSVELKVIKVEYLGAYSCIGVKYLNDDIEDFEPIVLDVFEKIKRYSITNFLQFIENNNSEINDIKDYINSI